MTFSSTITFALTLSSTLMVSNWIAPQIAKAGTGFPQTLAQSSQPATQPKPQTAPASQPAAPAGQSDSTEINLTPDQRQKIQSIMKSSNTQVMAVLTPEQKTKLQQASQQQQSPEATIASLKLTPDQSTKIRSIKVEEVKQIKAILTPEQIKMLESQPAPSQK